MLTLVKLRFDARSFHRSSMAPPSRESTCMGTGLRWTRSGDECVGQHYKHLDMEIDTHTQLLTANYTLEIWCTELNAVPHAGLGLNNLRKRGK